jgi:hypothetical protein
MSSGSPDPRPGVPDAAAVVPFDQIVSLIEREFPESNFVGIRPKGWRPARDTDLDKLEPSVRAELERVIPALDQHSWPEQGRRDLAADLREGDRIVRVDNQHVVVARRPPGLSFAFWREEDESGC